MNVARRAWLFSKLSINGVRNVANPPNIGPVRRSTSLFGFKSLPTQSASDATHVSGILSSKFNQHRSHYDDQGVR